MARTFRTILLSSAVALSALFLSSAQLSAQGKYTPTKENIESRQEFNQDRFGIFIHWGVYSMLGQGEWVMNNLNIPYKEYSHLADGFNPSKFNADEWVAAIKGSGAKYITITSRHHDGFSMFDTKASDYKITNTPFGRDVLKELSQSCQQQGIRLHFYYSHLDWGRDDYYPLGRTGHGAGRNTNQPSTSWKHYQDFMDQQLTELLTNYGKIGAIWFDGVWDKDAFPREDQPEIWGLTHQYQLIHSLQPGCLVANNHHLVPFEGEDIQTFERDVPGSNEAGYSADQGISTIMPLETCQTMNGSWGYRVNDTNYKSTAQIIKLLARTSGKGANLLLNIGPRPDGTLPDEAVVRLKEIGEWMGINSESIYGTSAGITGDQLWGVSTKKDNALYLHILDKTNAIVLPSESAKNILGGGVVSVTMLDGGKNVYYSVDKKTGNITIILDELDLSKGDAVVKVVFKKNI